MSTKHPRINLSLEEPVFETIALLAKKNHKSLASQAKDLILESLDIFEDVGLAKYAEEREKTFNRKKALSHQDFWKRAREKD